MQKTSIDSVLETIEQNEFLSPTFIASGHNTVADILATTSEVKFLLDNKDSSLSLMRTRYRDRDLSMPERVRLVYFVVFGLAQDRDVVSEMVSYLRRCKSIQEATLLSPWHPFLHGEQALAKITGNQVQAPSSSAAVEQLDDFLSKVENWMKQKDQRDH